VGNKKGEAKEKLTSWRETISPLLLTLYPGVAPTTRNKAARENMIVGRRIEGA
jgi:hypothetical protein